MAEVVTTSFEDVKEDRLGILDSKKNQFVDIDLKMQLNPVTKDITVKKDISAINQSLKNNLLTNFFDRPFKPNFGGNLYKVLFEPADPISLINMSKEIEDILKSSEPRIIVLDVNVESDFNDENNIIITIVYTLPAMDGEITTQFAIERVR